MGAILSMACLRSLTTPGSYSMVVTDAVDPGTLAGRLDSEFGVMTRAGLHCAPEAHRILGTLQTGAVRFSVGWATTDEDVDAAVHAVDRIAGRRPVSLA